MAASLDQAGRPPGEIPDRPQSASLACVVAASCVRRPGLALVDMSVVEQRYRAVLAVLAGGSVTEVARDVEVGLLRTYQGELLAHP
ncbi:hypothetical protein FR742_00190 [Nonomuraea sp. C10]|nr:hypothetical protein FR742_00190 [Nonomuraea sp. C10]